MTQFSPLRQIQTQRFVVSREQILVHAASVLNDVLSMPVRGIRASISAGKYRQPRVSLKVSSYRGPATIEFISHCPASAQSPEQIRWDLLGASLEIPDKPKVFIWADRRTSKIFGVKSSSGLTASELVACARKVLETNPEELKRLAGL